MAKKFFSKINLNWRAYAAEFLGTFVFVLISLGAALADTIDGQLGLLGISIASGFVYMAMVFATVGISGGHLNPAISLSLWFAKKLSTFDVIFYILAQFMAGLAAAGVLFYIFGQDTVLSLQTAGGVSMQTAVAVEAIMAAVLVFVYFATLVDRKGPSSFGPFALGLTVVASYLFAAPVFGSFINPAKALAFSLLSSSYSELVFWMVGPFTGSLFGLVYEFLFLRKTSK